MKRDQPKYRVEDEKFLRGQGRFVADIAEPNVLHAVFLRSPHAHARITSLDCDAARAMPGVLAIMTGADVLADDLGGIPWEVRPPGANFAGVPMGDAAAAASQPLIANDTVRYAGEIVAMVVATTYAAALDASERVAVDYKGLSVFVDPTTSDATGDPIWANAAGNLCFEFEAGESDAVAKGFASASVKVRFATHNQRIAAAPMEPRAYIGSVLPDSDVLLLQASAGKPHFARQTMASQVFRVPLDHIQVETPDVGGGFGAKNILYPEECLVVWAARRLRRSVKWVSTRAEAFSADLAGRDQHIVAEMAFDSTGRILAYRCDSISNLGAYLAPRGVVPIRHSANALSSVYAIPALHFRARGIFTNTAPTCSLRGTGAPEIAHATERLLDLAAVRLQINPLELRRRNILGAAHMPYVTPHGIRYDSGDPRRAMEDAHTLADTIGFEQRRLDSAARGRLRGIGMANGIEILNVFYDESAWLALNVDGSLLCRMGTQSSGQGHATAYAQIVAERLGVPCDSVFVVQGDTRVVPFGNGTGASRSLSAGGSAAYLAAEAFVACASDFVSAYEDCDVGDVEHRDGAWHVRGTNRVYDLRHLASCADTSGRLESLSVRGVFKPTDGTYPYGCDICEVEVDPETGEVTICAYTSVHDVGRVMNHAIVDGQVHGSTLQGLGQGLLEHLTYDSNGQLLSGSFLDYAMPTASVAPRAFSTSHLEIASPANPLGAKGVGESGTTGAPPALINAIVAALRPLGVTDVAMPATPFRVWKAIRDAADLR